MILASYITWCLLAEASFVWLGVCVCVVVGVVDRWNVCIHSVTKIILLALLLLKTHVYFILYVLCAFFFCYGF